MQRTERDDVPVEQHCRTVWHDYALRAAVERAQHDSAVLDANDDAACRGRRRAVPRGLSRRSDCSEEQKDEGKPADHGRMTSPGLCGVGAT